MKRFKRVLYIFSITLIVAALFLVDYSALFSRQNLAPLLIIIAAAGNIVVLTMHKDS
ncbi:MAG: hypothetical protein U5K32_02205 [Bacteroidales bacterium]|nr:hypothetical protein [Bacteroidales bacterium]